MHNVRAELRPSNTGANTMKKFFLALAALATLVAVTSCGSLRTPTDSANNGKVWYNTFFGASIESAVYGDGFIVK